MANVVAFVLSSPQLSASALRLLLPSRIRVTPPSRREAGMVHVVAFVLLLQAVLLSHLAPSACSCNPCRPQHIFAGSFRHAYACHRPPGGRLERCVCVFTVAMQQRLKAMPLHVAGYSCSSLYKACAPGGGVRLKEVAATCLKCHFKNLSDFSGKRGKQTKAVPPRGTKSHKSREKIHTKTM